MGQYTNQAKRVVEHIASQCNISVDDVNKVFGISVGQIELKIIEIVQKSGINGKQAADAIIKLWDESHPDKTTDA